MAINMVSLLDNAKVAHRLPSDYKLALVLGIDQKSLRNYRDSKTLPDARVLVKLCELTGDDPAILLAEIEEQRAKTDEAKALWHQIAARLQSAAAAGVFSVVFLIAAMGGLPMSEASARAQFDSFISYTSWKIKPPPRKRPCSPQAAWNVPARQMAGRHARAPVSSGLLGRQRPSWSACHASGRPS
ncbi:DUF3693 domain-containing protein [Hydrogenophaga sp.]|uniref:DUF3693 domain-containing protein n=1 Tax=Hydrogenophaga sp. TaxID=1904254 RepID=UPI003D0F3606